MADTPEYVNEPVIEQMVAVHGTPDTAQRLAGIRFRLDARQGGLGAGGDINADIAFLLDHIDTLTAKLAECRRLLQTETDRQCELVEELEKAEAERDALRASLHCGYCASARQQSPGQLDGCLMHFPWQPDDGGQ